MTKRHLVVWLESHRCEIRQLPEGRARAVMYINPKTGGHAFIETPIDDHYEMKNYTIYRICTLLGIPIPDCACHLKDLNTMIEQNLRKRGS